MDANALWTTQDACRGHSPRKGERYVLTPCAGRMNGPVKVQCPLYLVRDCAGAAPITIGFMVLEKAAEAFGKDQLYLSPSHTICPECAAAGLRT